MCISQSGDSKEDMFSDHLAGQRGSQGRLHEGSMD